MTDFYNLKGKTAWIIGGKRIGQRIAEVLAGHGANLIISYNSSSEEAEETAQKARKLGARAATVKADASKREEVESAISEMAKNFKKIDILVLMASVFDKMPLESVTDKELDRNFAVHVKGTFWPIIESMNFMPAGSHIITVCDRTSVGRMYAGYFPYVITKGTIAFMTRELAEELGSKGIFINSIAPGPILKPKELPDSEWKKIREKSMIKYPITDGQAVDEFAKLVLYLSTVRSSGSVYPLDLGHM